MRRAQKTGKQVEILVSRELGGRLSQVFTNVTETRLQFTSIRKSYLRTRCFINS